MPEKSSLGTGCCCVCGCCCCGRSYDGWLYCGCNSVIVGCFGGGGGATSSNLFLFLPMSCRCSGRSVGGR